MRAKAFRKKRENFKLKVPIYKASVKRVGFLSEEHGVQPPFTSFSFIYIVSCHAGVVKSDS